METIPEKHKKIHPRFLCVLDRPLKWKRRRPVWSRHFLRCSFLGAKQNPNSVKSETAKVTSDFKGLNCLPSIIWLDSFFFVSVFIPFQTYEHADKMNICLLIYINFAVKLSLGSDRRLSVLFRSFGPHFRPCWLSWCRRRSTLRWKPFEQMSHPKGLNPVCFLLWVIRLELWLKALPHTWHLWGFSPAKSKTESNDG